MKSLYHHSFSSIKTFKKTSKIFFLTINIKMLVFKYIYQVLKPTIMIQLSTMNYRLDMKMRNKLIRDGSWKLVKHLMKIEKHLHCHKKITKIDWERCHLNLSHLKFCCCIYAKNYQLVVQTSTTIYCNKIFIFLVSLSICL